MIDVTEWEARRHFEAFVEQVEYGEAVTVTRDGEPVAIIVGMDEYERLSAAVKLRVVAEDEPAIAPRRVLRGHPCEGLAVVRALAPGGP